jgi:hypothetical protein
MIMSDNNQIHKCRVCEKEYSFMNIKLINTKRGVLKLCSWCYREVRKYYANPEASRKAKEEAPEDGQDSKSI